MGASFCTHSPTVHICMQFISFSLLFLSIPLPWVPGARFSKVRPEKFSGPESHNEKNLKP